MAWISIRISLECFSRVQLTVIPALVQIIAWRRPCDNPLSEPMVVNAGYIMTQICAIRPKWSKVGFINKLVRDVSFFVIIMLPFASQIKKKNKRSRNLSRYLWITVGKFVQDNVIIKANDTVWLPSDIYLSCSLWITMKLTLPTS